MQPEGISRYLAALSAWSRLAPLLAALVLLLGSITPAAAQAPGRRPMASAPAPPLSPEQIAYWRAQSRELTPADDPWAATAHAVFGQLVQVAGKRPGVVPRLFITARDPREMILPIAIRDGWIILSRHALQICVREPRWAKDRLAFLLAHELAHHLKDDLWHIRFFEAQEARQRQTPPALAFLEELRRSTEATEHVLAREVQADQQGILYATMAGFAPQAIVAPAQGVNFFADWVRALDPRPLLGINVARLRPTPEERAEALHTVLRQIATQAVTFQAGLWWYYAGDYPQAIQAFDAFRGVFAAPEVHFNLAVSHHQLALQAAHAASPEAPPFPFALALAIEPLTRASQIYLERTRSQPPEPAGRMQDHLEAAIWWYREALAQDPTSTLVARNLSAALLFRGALTPKVGLHSDVAEALMLLSRALDHTPQDPALLNTRGVAYVYDERLDRATADFTQAAALDPTDPAPVLNLGVLTQTPPRATAAQRWPEAAAHLRAGPPLMPSPSPPPVETVRGVRPGTPVQEIPADWGVPVTSTVEVGGRAYAVTTYPTGIMTLAQDSEVLMLMVREGYQGASAREIRLGSRAHDLLARYGPPTRRHALARGDSWAYEGQRIAFQLHDGQVVSWLRF